jgi:hypothetical protein
MQMKLLLQVLAIGLLPSVCAAKGEPAATAQSQQSRGLFFMENKGQITDQYYKARPDIDFSLPGRGFNMFVGDGQMHYQFIKVENQAELEAQYAAGKKDPLARDKADVTEKLNIYRVDVELLGANKNAVAVSEGRQAYYETYYTETTPKEGALVHSFNKVVYKEIYPNIDWVLYTKDNEFKYEFVVRPGGDPSNIKMKYSGATALNIGKDGALTVKTPLGDIHDQAPYSFVANGKKVATSFILNNDVLSFQIDDYEGELTIDPTVVWGTYYGGSSNSDFAYGVAASRDGSEVYLTGYTSSTNSTSIATSGSFQQSASSTPDAFLAKFNATGVRQWATYYGGSSTEQGYCVALDNSGNVFMIGYTMSSGSTLGTSGVYQQSWSSGRDAYVAKFNSSGTRLWGTYAGGTSDEYAYGLAVDATGDVFLSGYSNAGNTLASPFSHQQNNLNQDAYVVKFNGSNGQRIWGTYFGGNSTELGFGVACDRSGNAILVGYTTGSTSGIASTNAHQGTYNANNDGFVVKFSAAQGTRLWGTYYGGSNTDYLYSVACGGDSNMIAVTGFTYSTSDIASGNGFKTTGDASYGDAFLVKFDSAGNRVWGTYFGGDRSDYPEFGAAANIDLNDNIYICGITYSNSGLAQNGIYNSLGGGSSGYYDAYLAKFLPGGNLDWATYYGGSSTTHDYGYGVGSDFRGNVYLCGRTSSSNQIATSGGHQPTSGSTTDGFLVKIRDCALPGQPGTITGPTTVCEGNATTYSISAVTGATTYQWILPPGWTGTSNGTSITVTPNGTSGTIRVKAGVTCGMGEARSLAINILPAPGAVITPSGPTEFCAGSNVTLTANTGTNLTYVWKNGTNVLGTTTNAHVASTSGLYTVEITSNVNNCTSYSAVEVVTVNPNPAINFPPFSFGCTNHAPINLSATPTGGTYSGAGVSGNTLNLLNAGPGIHSIVYTVTDSNNCTSTANQSITINPAPVVNFPAFNNICADVLVPLNMATPPGGVYTGTGVTGTNFSPFVSGAGSFNVTYTYIDNNNCQASQVQPITVYPLTSVNFPSITPKCIDAPIVNLFATPSGGTFSGSGVVNTQFHPLTGAGNHVVHYYYTNQYNCTTHDSETIVVNPLPTLNFANMGGVCDNAPVTMTATPAGGTYTGPGTGNGAIFDPAAAGVGAHAITYTYTDANTCTNSTTSTVQVDPQPVITSQPYIFVEICEGEPFAVNVGATNAGGYQWQHNSVDIAGANSTSYLVNNAQTVNSGNYQVIVNGVGACAAVELLSSSTAVLVNSNPAVNLTPGSDTICAGDTMMLNSGLTSGMSYVWRLNGQNIPGATSYMYPATAAGVYRVIATNLNTGCDATSTDVTIGVNPSPDATIMYSGPTEFCEGNSLQINNEDTANNVTFQWTNNGQNINGANANSYTANASGQYAVVLTNSYSCVRTSSTVDVTVNPLPTPTVTVLDELGNMTTGQYSYYQWKKDNVDIQGANSQNYQATGPGQYTVMVRDTNGCENTSSSIDPTSVANVKNGGSNFVLYPNPNNGTFTIDGTLKSGDGMVALEIVDVTGKLVYREDVKMSGDKLSKQLNVSNVASGAYMIRVVSDSAREVIPFVKH